MLCAPSQTVAVLPELWQSLSTMLMRPLPEECSEYFWSTYISKVPDRPLLHFLARQLGEYREFFGRASEHAAGTRPRADKWSEKEVLGHVCDTERIMSYRALRFARGDGQPLEGFDQDPYVREAHSNDRRIGDLMEEFEGIRKASLSLLGSLNEETEARSGVASGSQVTVRALAYIIAGHAEHHLLLLRAQRLGRGAAA